MLCLFCSGTNWKYSPPNSPSGVLEKIFEMLWGAVACAQTLKITAWTTRTPQEIYLRPQTTDVSLFLLSCEHLAAENRKRRGGCEVARHRSRVASSVVAVTRLDAPFVSLINPTGWWSLPRQPFPCRAVVSLLQQGLKAERYLVSRRVKNVGLFSRLKCEPALLFYQTFHCGFSSPLLPLEVKAVTQWK